MTDPDRNDHDSQLLKVMIVEDEDRTRERLVDIVNSSNKLVLISACVTKHQAEEFLKQKTPDILLVDIGLPDGSGIELLQTISDLELDCDAVMVTIFEDNKHIMEAISAGASGYILKDDESIAIIDAIMMIKNGGAPISPSIARHLLSHFQLETKTSPQTDDNSLEQLTSREREILVMVSNGYTDQEIATTHNISYNTVTTHVKHIYKKLRVNSRVEATRTAVSSGLVQA